MNARNRIVIGLLAFNFLLADIFLPVLFSKAESQSASFVLSFLFGGLLAQVCLLAIWVVFAAEPLALRLPRTATFLVLTWAALTSGVRMAAQGNLPPQAVLDSGCIGGAIFLFVSLALLVMRRFTRRRIKHVDAPLPSLAARVQFSIANLLTWTALTGIILATVRLVLPPEELNFVWFKVEWIPFAFYTVLMGGVIVLFAVPCLMVTLDGKPCGGWLSVLAVIFGLLPLLLVALLCVLMGARDSDIVSRMIVMLYAFCGGIVVTLLGCLALVCQCGYRFRRAEFPTAPPK